MLLEYQKSPFLISTDPARLDHELIYDYLSRESYWAEGRSRKTFQKSLEHSLCYGLYEGERQAGFARAVTDYATFAYLADVFILPDYQGVGLGKWLFESMLQNPELKNLKRLLLATRDAHDLYARFGFEPMEQPEIWMEKRGPGK